MYTIRYGVHMRIPITNPERRQIKTDISSSKLKSFVNLCLSLLWTLMLWERDICGCDGRCLLLGLSVDEWVRGRGGCTVNVLFFIALNNNCINTIPHRASATPATAYLNTVLMTSISHASKELAYTGTYTNFKASSHVLHSFDTVW